MALTQIVYLLALVIGAAALIFAAVVMYKIFGGKKSKKVKPVKISKKEQQEIVKEDEKTAEPEIKLFATETSKVTGFELDDED